MPTKTEWTADEIAESLAQICRSINEPCTLQQAEVDKRIKCPFKESGRDKDIGCNEITMEHWFPFFDELIQLKGGRDADNNSR